MLNLPEMIKNVDGLYEGNLISCYKSILNAAKNLKNPYHNYRHMYHVMWSCYDACVFYKEILTPREMRNLLIAAIFHDFDHSGRSGNDDLNIELAIRGLRQHLPQDDFKYLYEIEHLIKTTQFPHIVQPYQMSLSALILRDADMSQGLSPVWVQEIIFGLSSEMNVMPIDVFRMQAGFFSKLELLTEWGQAKFPKELIDAKIAESSTYLDILA